MGWNSWNSFGCNINEALIRQTADAIVSSGMRDLGYNYVVVDDCWFNPNRDSSGNIQGDPSRFPSGMKALGDYLHARNLKFGLYQVPVDKTCAQYFGAYPGATGSRGHEVQDARQFAAWGVDFLKYDWCSPEGSINDQVTTFAKMRDALAATGRPIVYSINPNSIHAKTGPQRNWGDVANMWRTTEDITNAWDTGQSNGYPMGIQNIINVTVPLASYARPGGFNDPDMMEVGRGGMNDTEMRSHFAMWAIMASPLIAGNDVRNMNSATQTILKNANLIAINQDSLGLQGTQVSFDGTRRVLAKPSPTVTSPSPCSTRAARRRRSRPRPRPSASPARRSRWWTRGRVAPAPAAGRSVPASPRTAPWCSGSAVVGRPLRRRPRRARSRAPPPAAAWTFRRATPPTAPSR